MAGATIALRRAAAPRLEWPLTPHPSTAGITEPLAGRVLIAGTRWHACRSIVSLVFGLSIRHDPAPCALSTVGWNACRRVPGGSSEPDPFIKPKPAVIAAGLRHLESGDRRVEVAPEALGRSGMIAS